MKLRLRPHGLVVQPLIMLSSLLSMGAVVCAHGMTPMDDQALSETTGQAAYYTTYTAPSGSGTGATPTDYGFFTLGLNATTSLNANIDHLQLGCGGVNGTGCDIDINNLSLSGQGNGTDSNGNPTFSNAGGRAATDATLTNPFIQLAIKNPNSLSTRQVVGINLGAQKVLGLLTAGTQNPSSLNGATTNPTGVGINTLSGYMLVGKATGTAYTGYNNGTGVGSGQVNGANALVISYDGSTTPTQANSSPVPAGLVTYGTNTTISGQASATLFNLSFTSNQYDIVLPSTAVALTTNATTVNGTRVSSIGLTGTGVVGNIPLYGRLNASISGVLNLGLNVPNNGQTYLQGLTANVGVQEALSYIHTININNPLSLSLQSTKVQWPGSAAANVAQPGWWMGFGDTVNIGSVTPAQPVSITPVLVTALNDVSTYLNNNPVNCGLFALSCLTGTANIGPINLSGAAPLSLSLSNLALAAQTPPANCYGGLKFC